MKLEIKDEVLNEGWNMWWKMMTRWMKIELRWNEEEIKDEVLNAGWNKYVMKYEWRWNDIEMRMEIKDEVLSEGWNMWWKINEIGIILKWI